MVEKFTNLITEALDEVAPIESFTVKSRYKFGISEQTKLLMSKRDKTRMSMKQESREQKKILMTRYKKLRNQVNNVINYPLKLWKKSETKDSRTTRSTTSAGKLTKPSKTELLQSIVSIILS